MVRYLGLLRLRFCQLDGILDDAFPLFPDYLGRVVLKVGVVGSLENVLAGFGIATVDSSGKRIFGGHSLRVIGSRFWASQGLEVYKVQIFARWGSAVVVRYVADVPIANLTCDLALGSSGNGGLSASSVTRLAGLLEEHICSANQQIQTLKAQVTKLDASLQHTFVLNITSGAWHRVLAGGAEVPHPLWRALCGWWYGRSGRYSVSSLSPPPGARRCDRCFPVVPRVSSTTSDSSG